MPCNTLSTVQVLSNSVFLIIFLGDKFLLKLTISSIRKRFQIYSQLTNRYLNDFFPINLRSCYFLTCFVPCFRVFLVSFERVSSCQSGSEKNHVFVNMCLISFKNVFLQQSVYYLKVVSATFLLVLYFLSLKESTCETKKKKIYFTSKALFLLEAIKVYNVRYSNFMMSSNA